MDFVQLTKRNYLGESWVHAFRSDTDGSIKWVQCTRAEYERMGKNGGSQYNPTLDGYTWVSSYGGSLLVDTDDGVLHEDEYCEIGNEVVIKLGGVPEDEKIHRLPKGKIVATDRVNKLDLNVPSWQ